MLEIHDAMAATRFLRCSGYQKYMALKNIVQWCHIVTERHIMITEILLLIK